MIVGAARELKVGDPRRIATQVGPVIDRDAERLDRHVARMKREARVHYAGEAPADAFTAPHVFELESPKLAEEVFGRSCTSPATGRTFDRVLDAVDETGYGLTLGVHSRIDETVERVVERLSVGNVYVNRNMIGAVVGVQPFSGHVPWSTGEGRRPALSSALRHRAGGHDQHGGGGRKCRPIAMGVDAVVVLLVISRIADRGKQP